VRDNALHRWQVELIGIGYQGAADATRRASWRWCRAVREFL